MALQKLLQSICGLGSIVCSILVKSWSTKEQYPRSVRKLQGEAVIYKPSLTVWEFVRSCLSPSPGQELIPGPFTTAFCADHLVFVCSHGIRLTMSAVSGLYDCLKLCSVVLGGDSAFQGPCVRWCVLHRGTERVEETLCNPA